jgi:hypothetical protein
LKETLQTGVETIDRPLSLTNSSGEKTPISISTAVLRNDNGEVLGAVETFGDLSAIENLRKELYNEYSFEDIISKSPGIVAILRRLIINAFNRLKCGNLLCCNMMGADETQAR